MLKKISDNIILFQIPLGGEVWVLQQHKDKVNPDKKKKKLRENK